MFDPSCILLSKSAYQHNIKLLKDYIGENAIFASVIKGNAYGHGIDQLLPLAEACSVNHFCVFSADEALQALKASQSRQTTIIIMGLVTDEQLDWAIQHDIECYIFDVERLESGIKFAKRQNKKIRIHLQLETGMNRTGLEKDDLTRIVRLIGENAQYVETAGLCTHFAGAESVGNYLRIQNQIRRFNLLCRWFRLKGIEPALKHTACSAAMLNYSETIMDMVRVGIAHYGFWPNRETYMNVLKKNTSFKDIQDPLKRVISWKSRVMSIKKVSAGDFIGYGNVYLANRDMTIATVPVGYTHGFKRDLTNRGLVLIKGERAHVVGLVNMNMITVDITDIEGVQKGDEVVIIGNQGKQTITVASFSDISENLNYEVLTRLPSELPRIVVE